MSNKNNSPRNIFGMVFIVTLIVVCLAWEFRAISIRSNMLQLASEAMGSPLPSILLSTVARKVNLGIVDKMTVNDKIRADQLVIDVKKLVASDGMALDDFGISVAISGDIAIVGADIGNGRKGSAYIFERSKGGGNNWNEIKKLIASDGMVNDRFGYAVAISGDTAIVGALGHSNNKGTAYIFKRNSGGEGNWGEVKKLIASDGKVNEHFGISVAISDDNAIVGANYSDSKGAAYIFVRNYGGQEFWGEVKKLTASDGSASDQFGLSTAISGNTAIVGAYQRGAAYIFERDFDGGRFWGETKKLFPTEGITNGRFGFSVAISGDTAIVGAYSDNDFKGAAHIFLRNQGGPNFWGNVKKLTPSDEGAYQYFGFSVAISNDIASVGAFVGNNRKGASYLFGRNKGGADLWNEIKKLTAPDGMELDSFGRSIATSGDLTIVGAVTDDNNKGSAYIFACEESTIAITCPPNVLAGIYGSQNSGSLGIAG